MIAAVTQDQSSGLRARRTNGNLFWCGLGPGRGAFGFWYGFLSFHGCIASSIHKSLCPSAIRRGCLRMMKYSVRTVTSCMQILGDVHMQRLRRSAVEPLTEKQLNEFKQSRALIQVLACILTVLGFPIVLILLCRAVRAARRGGGGKLEQDTTQGLLEPSLRIGNIGNSSQFLASISQNYKSSGSIQRKLSAKPLSSDDVTPTLGYGRRGNQFASATFNTQSQSNKLMRLHEVLLDVVNGQNIQMRYFLRSSLERLTVL